MELKTPEGWERLTCSCGQSRFAPMTHLRWKPNGGLTQEQAGFFCLECHAVVDSATLIQKAMVKAKQRELKELEAEIQETTGAPAPRVPATAKK